jgi:hypothetical protein
MIDPVMTDRRKPVPDFRELYILIDSGRGTITVALHDGLVP